jgi:hypothetical protein
MARNGSSSPGLKMNKTAAGRSTWCRGLKRELANIKEVDIVVCPGRSLRCARFRKRF